MGEQSSSQGLGGEPLTLGLVSEKRDHVDLWSGTIHYLLTALEKQNIRIVPVRPTWPRRTRILLAINGLFRRLFGRDPRVHCLDIFARMKGNRLRKNVSAAGLDLIVAPVSATFMAFYDGPEKVISVSDATMRLLIDYYPRYSSFTRFARQKADEYEWRSLQRSDLVLYPTEWAGRSAREDYGVPEDRIFVKAFGPNLTQVPTRSRALAPRTPGPFRLLFCGVEWERKGGPVLMDAFRRVRARFPDCTLTIVGTEPPFSAGVPAGVTIVPRLDKSRPAEAAELQSLFLDADLFVLPTHADCYGMVFCEAAACGTPSVARATGGIPEVVRDGITGRLVPETGDGAAFGDAMTALLSDPEHLENLRRAARDDYEARLNWDVWGAAAAERIRQLAAAPRRQSAEP